MFITYFERKPQYRYNCHPKKGFKYGVQIDLWENNRGMEMPVEEFMFPLIAWLVETYGYDIKRYEPIFDGESDTAFVYFRDDEDRVAFKLIWGENPSEWDDENECYVREGKRINAILHI